MNSHCAKKSRVAFALATVAHVLGWAAFLWMRRFRYSGFVGSASKNGRFLDGFRNSPIHRKDECRGVLKG